MKPTTRQNGMKGAGMMAMNVDLAALEASACDHLDIRLEDEMELEDPGSEGGTDTSIDSLNPTALLEALKKLNADTYAANEDRELIDMIDQWQESRAKAVHDKASRLEIVDRMDALEGRIRRLPPCSFRGVTKMLDMAFAIAAAQRYDPDSTIGEGPLVDLIALVRRALANQSGAIG